MIRYDFLDNDRKVRHIYFAKQLDLHFFEKETEDCDELAVYYSNSVDDSIYQKYGRTFVYMTKGWSWDKPSHSIMIDLRNDEDKIFGEFRKNCRYEIKRAKERDNLYTDINMEPDEKDLSKVAEYYNVFAKAKGLPFFSISRYRAAMNAGLLTIGMVRDSSDSILVCNGCLLDRDEGISTFSFGASHFRVDKEKAALISRANRYLHYEMMCYLKKNGYIGYDFGGLYIGDDLVLNGISDFKRGFGGEILEYAPKFIFQKKDLETVNHNINLLDRIGNRGIIVYGLSTWGGYVIEKLRERYAISPLCIIDNFSSDSNVRKSTEINKYNPNNAFIIVTTRMDNYKKIINEDCLKPFVSAGAILCIREERL